MKAIQIHEHGSPDVLRYEDVEMPTPGAGEVLIRVESIGVNYADIAQRQGLYVTDLPLPTILGLEVAGIIVELGTGVNHMAIGTRVAGLGQGGYAEYVVLKASHIIPIPESISTDLAASFPLQGLTAYQILREAGRLQPGESVLVHAAAGGVGTLALQLARLMGAKTIIGTASSPAKLDLVQSLNADIAINYNHPDWIEQIKHATSGRGVDLVLEMAGGEITQQSLQCLAPFGRMVIFGSASGESGQFTGSQLTQKCISIIGYWLVTWLSRPESIKEAITYLITHLVQGNLKPVIYDTFPLAEAATAHRLIEERRTTGKVLLRVPER